MPLRRSYFTTTNRLYAPFVESGTLRHRNADGTMKDALEVQWRMSWKPISEEMESTENEAITTTRRTWILWRKKQTKIPNVGDQIIDVRGNVWEVLGPIGHRLRETIYDVPCICSDMQGKVVAQ